MISSQSDGRKFAHTASESAISLKDGDTRDNWHASLGDVKEIIVATHSSGRTFVMVSIFL